MKRQLLCGWLWWQGHHLSKVVVHQHFCVFVRKDSFTVGGTCAVTGTVHCNRKCNKEQEVLSADDDAQLKKKYLQMSDFLLLVPLRAQWLPKYTSLKMPGKWVSIQFNVGSCITCCLDVTTTKSKSDCNLWRLGLAPASEQQLLAYLEFKLWGAQNLINSRTIRTFLFKQAMRSQTDQSSTWIAIASTACDRVGSAKDVRNSTCNGWKNLHSKS